MSDVEHSEADPHKTGGHGFSSDHAYATVLAYGSTYVMTVRRYTYRDGSIAEDIVVTIDGVPVSVNMRVVKSGDGQ